MVVDPFDYFIYYCYCDRTLVLLQETWICLKKSRAKQRRRKGYRIKRVAIELRQCQQTFDHKRLILIINTYSF